jgi:type III pantothenate kinase
MILMIDWGNTQLKFIQCDSLLETDLIKGQLFCVDDLVAFEQQINQQFDLILISSVRSKQENDQLLSILKSKSKVVFFARTSSMACGVTCAYNDPLLLGIDRWLGVLGAEKSTKTIGLVSIGTAITLDLVNNKRHLGGHILPGRQLMLESLLSTGQVRPEINSVSEQAYLLGNSTSECVNYGVDAGIYAYLTCVMQSMQKQHQVDQWVFTGGGGKFWADKLNKRDLAIAFEPLSVFIGLAKLYLDNQKI